MDAGAGRASPRRSARTSRRRGAARAARRGVERGAVLVEAALVLPILFTLIFGVVEYGLFLKNSNIITAASAAGARTAVAQPRTTGYQTAAQSAAQAVLTGATGTPVQIVVYRAYPTTGRPCAVVAFGAPCSTPIATTASYDSCTQCYVFDYSAGTWTQRSGKQWLPTDEAACGAVATTDFLGVYVRFRHDDVTGFFGSSHIIESKTMMRLEPVPVTGTSGCRP